MFLRWFRLHTFASGPHFCLFLHFPILASTDYLYLIVSGWYVTFKNEASAYFRSVSEEGPLSFRWFHTRVEDLGPPVFLGLFNYRSHSPVAGWPTTSTWAWVTQRSGDLFRRLCVLLFHVIFLPSPLASYPLVLWLIWTYHITLHSVYFILKWRCFKLR